MYKESRLTAMGFKGYPVLVVVEDKSGSLKRGEKYIFRENITIGRGQHNDIVIRDRYVSNSHAVITSQGESWQLTDLGSTNGTYINNTKLTNTQSIKPGDKINIAGVTFKVGWENASRSSFPYRTGAAR